MFSIFLEQLFTQLSMGIVILCIVLLMEANIVLMFITFIKIWIMTAAVAKGKPFGHVLFSIFLYQKNTDEKSPAPSET